MRKYPTKKLIQETKALIRLYLFLRHEVGLKEDLSIKDLKVLLEALRQAKRVDFELREKDNMLSSSTQERRQ